MPQATHHMGSDIVSVYQETHPVLLYLLCLVLEYWRAKLEYGRHARKLAKSPCVPILLMAAIIFNQTELPGKPRLTWLHHSCFFES